MAGSSQGCVYAPAGVRPRSEFVELLDEPIDVVRFGDFKSSSPAVSLALLRQRGAASGRGSAMRGPRSQPMQSVSRDARPRASSFLFGPSYKGRSRSRSQPPSRCPITASPASASAFDRKEAKDHGEGGALRRNAASGLRHARPSSSMTSITSGVCRSATRSSCCARPRSERGPAPIIAVDRQERGKTATVSPPSRSCRKSSRCADPAHRHGARRWSSCCTLGEPHRCDRRARGGRESTSRRTEPRT